MIIHNVRLKFANNSSSSHSFIFMPAGHKTQDQGCDTGKYGWNFFTAVSRESKLQYLGVLLRDKIEMLLAQERKNPEPFSKESEYCIATANQMAAEFIGAPLNVKSYIDHQSVWGMPLAWDEKRIHAEFASAFKKWIVQGDLAILGGNDNSSKRHPLAKGHANFSLPIERDVYSNIIARYDAREKFWTLFNRQTGAKVRMSFDHVGDNKKHVYKASAPELVDLKITDYCPFRCKFCYQGSTTYGKHANFDELAKIIAALAEMKVFEIAIGGGEPTMHPQFIALLKLCRAHYIVPNFTTYDLQWLKNHDFAMEVFKHCGSFAVSVQNAEKVGELISSLAGLPVIMKGCGKAENNINVSAQTVLGVVRENDLTEIVRAISNTKIDLTLLGYKATHRGAQYEPRHDFDWVKVLKENSSYARVAVDTLLAQQSLARLREEKIPEWMYHLEEGKFSMYIDAVTMQAGPSSYCETSFVGLDQLHLPESIASVFLKF